MKSRVVLFILSFFLLTILSPQKSFAIVLFQDNFDSYSEDSTPSHWIKTATTSDPLCTADWKVQSGMVGAKIVNQNSCAMNLIPDDTIWNVDQPNRIIEFDIKLVGGTDHNFIYLYNPPNPSDNFLELHFQSPNDFVLSVPNGSYTTNQPGSYPNGNQYHIKIIILDKNIKVYVDNMLVRDFTSYSNFQPGKIGLRATTGGDPNSETWFDNIKVSSIDSSIPPLSVPYFSQNSLPWGPMEYDHSKALGFGDTRIDRWGCAVTSAAMLLNFHGMTKFANNNPLNPGTLNDWLKDNKGFATGNSSDGPYSAILWPSIGRLSKELFDAGKSTTKLEYQRMYPSAETTTQLDTDLTAFPGIIRVVNASTSSHFVVIKGKTDTSYSVADPEWDVSTLASFNNTYSQVDRFVPSLTNLSYLLVVTNPSTDVLVSDPLGGSTGKVNYGTKDSETFSGIPLATYAFSPPIANPGTTGNNETLGTGINEFLYPKPGNGVYEINISSKKLEQYALDIITYDKDGKNAINHFTGMLSPDHPESFTLTYSQDTGGKIKHVSTFQTLIDDINELVDKKELQRTVGLAMIRIITTAEKSYEKKNRMVMLANLFAFEQLLNPLPKLIISISGKEILKTDLVNLRSFI